VQDSTSTGHSSAAPSPPPTQINKLKLGPITIKREKRQNSSRFNVITTNRELQVLQSLNGMYVLYILNFRKIKFKTSKCEPYSNFFVFYYHIYNMTTRG